jgi:adenylate cyclase
MDDNDIFGDGVNIAARLEGIAEPGGMCISDDAHRQIRGKTEIVYDDMGHQSLKNIAEPMRAWRARAIGNATQAGVAVERPPPKLALPDKPLIIVLPFQNMSGDPEQDYFADGMVEDITTGLSRIKWLFVIARNSRLTYKGKAVDVRQVGRELGVREILIPSRCLPLCLRTRTLLDAVGTSHLCQGSDIVVLHGLSRRAKMRRAVAKAVQRSLH